MQIQCSYEDTFVQQYTLCAENRKPCVRICLRKREGLFNGNIQQNPNAQHPVSLTIFTSLPGSRLRFFIAMQIQYSY